MAQSRRILQPRQRRLGTQIPARIRQATAGELERWIAPQMIEVVGVLVAGADREHASAEHIDKTVNDPRRIAPIREHPGQIDGQTETPLGHRENFEGAPLKIWEVLFVDTKEFRLYNNAFTASVTQFPPHQANGG